MWNNQYGNILQKEFGFYFSSDNAAYPNVWINSATRSSRGAIRQRTLHAYPAAIPDATCSRAS